MISEVSSTDFDRYGNMSKMDSNPTIHYLYEKIFIPPMNTPLGNEFRVEGKVEYEWGGEGGGKGKIGASVEASDHNGNSAKASFEQSSDGNGRISASAIHDSNKSERK